MFLSVIQLRSLVFFRKFHMGYIFNTFLIIYNASNLLVLRRGVKEHLAGTQKPFFHRPFSPLLIFLWTIIFIGLWPVLNQMTFMPWCNLADWLCVGWDDGRWNSHPRAQVTWNNGSEAYHYWQWRMRYYRESVCGRFGLGRDSRENHIFVSFRIYLWICMCV